ncbi:molybdopterin molybdochelatase [Novosphingobium sp. Rr 2-17]|uniref:molybdopterin molybdotransferase MoeA n=1 Tax=Novosphingobium sp. Rr 2-17 TaxID=555793 RepID=UPI0002699E90|nr:molybdopterin molybdochelatase [Novosphingobium sp. Rr 2-17]
MAGSPPISLEEAQARLLALTTPLAIERVDIEGALGRYLAEPIQARRTQPATDLSAMDGYAVAQGDLTGPWRVVGESAAGHPFAGEVSPGEAIRISTGAALCPGAHAVILQEDIARNGDTISLSGTGPEPGHKHVRPCGMDFSQGADVLPAGVRIGPAQSALAIAAGHAHLPVRRAPRVVIIDSGDELADDPEACAPHQIPASNGAMLLAMVRSLPVEAVRIGPVGDTLAALAAAFARCEDADVIVTSGGASVGDHDLIRPALEAWGAKIDFWRVAIKPGKPILIATRQARGRQQIILGLPGNPASSMITAFLFLLPLLRALLGAKKPLPFKVLTRLGAPLRPGGARREFLRAAWDGEHVVAHSVQDSGAMASLAASNAFIDRAVKAPASAKGEEVCIYLLENGGIA